MDSPAVATLGDHREGTRIGPYRVLKQLGAGGMGEVYLAEQTEPVRRQVALKVIKLGMDTGEVIARFEAERQALARMNHPAIAQVFEAGSGEDGRPYFAMEYVPGVPITESCDQLRLGIIERIRLFQGVCHGVQHAHQKGIVHRDLKPGNVLVQISDDGTPSPKIIDFGVAKAIDPLTEKPLVTEQGRVLGTPEYMSPEQADYRGLHVDTRTDIYALGVLLYELLTGCLPFDKKELLEAGYTEMRRRIQEDEPARPSTRLTTLDDGAHDVAKKRSAEPGSLARSLRGDLDWITMRCLEKSAARRYQAATELAADLERHLRHDPVEARPPSRIYVLRKFLRKRRGPVIAATAVFAALIAGLAVAWWQRDVAMANEARAVGAERETRRALSDYRDMRDVPLCDDLLAEADEELWPAHPDRVPAMDVWLLRARQLAARAEGHGQRLERIRDRGEREGEAGSGHWRFADYEDRFLYAIFHGLVANLDLLTERALPALVDRRQRAATLRFRSIDGCADGWARAIDEIAASHRYQGMPAIEPQLGLVPLGVDLASGLQEFALLDTGDVPKRDPDGRLAIDAETAIVFVLIPHGTFRMGAQKRDPDAEDYDPGADDDEADSEGRTSEVALDAFFMSKYELTQRQWHRLMGRNPSAYPAGGATGGHTLTGQHPVENVSYNECVEALRRLGLLVPTEAQWEYCARAGTTTPWWTGETKATLQDAANLADRYCKENGAPATWLFDEDLDDGHTAHAPVGSFSANGFGLHDTVGNVWEWCRDLHGPYDLAPRVGDGLRAHDSGGYQMLRGGCFSGVASEARSAERHWSRPQYRIGDVGLRPARRVMR